MAQQTISKMETVQTAVEWLAEKIYHEGLDDEFVKQAKEMEKEQMLKIWMEFFPDSMHSKDDFYKFFEKYYNETYKK